LLLLVVAWVAGEGAQWLQLNRAKRLLAEVRSIDVNHSQWADAQGLMQRWDRWGSAAGACTSDYCKFNINVEQTLPRMLIGNPSNTVGNWLPRLADRVGLRSSAVRAGIVVEHGVITTKWFGEQVTMPISEWEHTVGYIPYVSVLSGESSEFHVSPTDRDHSQPRHLNRMVQPINNYLVVSYTPEEDPAEKQVLMDFQLACITQITPCRSEREILPEAWRMQQENLRSADQR
jgi:hypothetical protein